MASIQERLKLKRAPTDIWSVREQLCLASSVLKSGDQNWMSVSRSIKPIADKDSIRPPDWFSQKSCAQQYAYLLENTDIPKRKKRESGETTSESIVRRLTQDRISELTKSLAAQREEFRQLKNEFSLLKNGTISDEKLQKMWHTIEQEEKEQEQKSKAHIAWLTKRQQSKESQTSTSNVLNTPKKVSDTPTENEEVIEVSIEEEEKRNKNGRSSLLTSLLKSPSPTTQIQSPTQVSGSPTIASLLCSSPKVPGPVTMQNVSPQLHQLVTNTGPTSVQERPSASAPTLSMLLEQPSAGTQRALQQQLQNASNLINTKNLQTSGQVQNTIQTRSARLSQGNNTPITQIQVSELPSTEIPQIIANPIDEVMPKVMPMDKDEINEIIGDIEELIKEEITGSPKTIESPQTNTVEIIDKLSVPSPTTVTERPEPRNVDEAISLSNSPASEISIEDIDSSTSNIAEIIGTAIGTVESKSDVPVSSKQADSCEETKIVVEGIDKKIVESVILEEINIETKGEQNTIQNSEKEIEKSAEINIPEQKETVIDQEQSKHDDKHKEETSSDIMVTDKEQEVVASENNTTQDKDNSVEDQKVPTPEVVSISSDETNDSPKQGEKNNQISELDEDLKNEEALNNLKLNLKEEKNIEENQAITKIDNPKEILEVEEESLKNDRENVSEIMEQLEVKECEIIEQESNDKEKGNKQEVIEISDDHDINKEEEENEITKIVSAELDTTVNCETNNSMIEKDETIDSNNEVTVKREKQDDVFNSEEVKENENLKIDDMKDEVKIEPKKEVNEDKEEQCKEEKDEIKKENESDALKKESVESIGSVEELDEEEPTLSKLSGGRAMKTYSKRQNVAVDSESENDTGGETADYRAWKKSIMLVYNRLATHKYASIFLRPITEDQAPGYHSIIFRPMDLWTIKKNIDNGTIRSTTHFQRDVMLMFQNAIMFNKHNTHVHKMTLEMQEECLQHMQVLVQAAGQASFRRETRTAASSSNEATDSGLKRKWTHITSSPHEIESPRMKKRRKSEND